MGTCALAAYSLIVWHEWEGDVAGDRSHQLQVVGFKACPAQANKGHHAAGCARVELQSATQRADLSSFPSIAQPTPHAGRCSHMLIACPHEILLFDSICVVVITEFTSAMTQQPLMSSVYVVCECLCLPVPQFSRL